MEMTEEVWCSDICEYSRYCHFGKREIGKDPNDCSQYLTLEKIAWDCRQDDIEEAMEWDREHEPEDDDDWED